MANDILKTTAGILSVAGVACGLSCAHAALPLPKPLLDETAPKTAENRVIVLSGGCFWGVQAVFQHVKGVVRAVSGYAGGAAATANYETVSTGTTGHAESVEVTYDPRETSAGKLLQVFFSVAHDPTELNRQGPDTGTQYRSAIFYTSPEQEKIAQDYIAQLDAAHVFSKPIVTEVAPLPKFYPAEAYHQNYAAEHPDNPYIVANDLPKVADLRKEFKDIYVER
ncbi:MAG: peptide-methionine (S)-S-oxide reductase MsrA [Alphaproteobacteria bacterium]|nr:peptide-methionine (S)-S-oxide reductase MsrA [Alphaproteobacteria bacterium]